MNKKKTPEYTMISNHGKKQLINITNLPQIRLPPKTSILALINYVEQEHKNGRLQQITIKECQDTIILQRLDTLPTAHKTLAPLPEKH